MSNYNSILQSNNTDLQSILDAVNALPSSGTGEQVTPTISVNLSGLITATAGTKISTHQLAFQPAITITPTTTSQVAVSSGYYTGGDVIVGAIPSEYVVPSDTLNITSNGTFDVKNYVSATVSVAGSGSGDSSVENSIIERTISTYTNNEVTTIGNYAFYDCSKLATVSFPACTIIGSNAFHKCFSLTSVMFPACTIIGSDAFHECSSLTTVSFLECTTISDNAFKYCRSLTSISFPKCTTIGKSAFVLCSMTSISFPKCTTIGFSAFGGCTSLTTVSFPECTTISGYAFYNCSDLTSISFPKCTTIGISAFAVCPSLKTVSFPECTMISGGAFYNCSRLQSIYLLASSVCTLLSSSAFSKTSIWSNKGSIFVPASLVSSYKAATNWTYFSNRIYSA